MIQVPMPGPLTVRRRRLQEPRLEGWTSRASLALVSPTAPVRLTMEEEAIPPDTSAQRFAEIVEERNRALPGYALRETRLETGPKPTVMQRFEWESGGIPLHQLQRVWVEGEAGYVAGVTLPAALAEARESQIQSLLDLASTSPDDVSDRWHESVNAWSKVTSWY